MRFIKGYVAGVVEKGQEGKRYAVVGIREMVKSRSGFDSETLTEIMVAGNDFKDGLHNSYRKVPPQTEIYVPVQSEAEVFNGNARVRDRITGVPVRLQEINTSSQPVQPAKTA